MTTISKVSLRISFRNEFHRVALLGGVLSCQRLKDTVSQVLRHKLDSTNFCVQYQDEELDWITISSDEELAEAIHIHHIQRKPTFLVRITTPSSSSFSCSSTTCSTSSSSSAASNSIPVPPAPAPVLRYPNGDSISLDLPQSVAASKPNADSLKKQRLTLKKVTTSSSPSFNLSHVAWGKMWTRFNELMKDKTTENIAEAHGLLHNLLVMDGETLRAQILFEIARCNSLLGNLSDAVLYLAKAISAGVSDPKLIEETKDFDPIRQMEGFSALVSILKIRSTLPPGFLQYFISTLCCADASGDKMERVKWPIREGEKAAGKRSDE